MTPETLLPEADLSVVKQWTVVVQTPERSLDQLVSAIESNVALVQGAYSRCMYIRRGGQTRFKNEAGAHGGVEVHVRAVESAEIVLMLPFDLERLAAALATIRYHHVHEEPTIVITQTWGCLSGGQDAGDNPNRYWNRQDAAEIHGKVSKS